MYVETLNQFPGNYLSNYPERIAYYQMPPHTPLTCEASGLLPTTSPEANPRTSPASPFSHPPPTPHPQGMLIANNLHLSSPNSLHTGAPSAPGWRAYLSSLPGRAAGSSDWPPRTRSFLWLACGSINPFFQDSFQFQRFLFDRRFLFCFWFFLFLFTFYCENFQTWATRS